MTLETNPRIERYMDTIETYSRLVFAMLEVQATPDYRNAMEAFRYASKRASYSTGEELTKSLDRLAVAVSRLVAVVGHEAYVVGQRDIIRHLDLLGAVIPEEAA